jgi:hypothetical protein
MRTVGSVLAALALCLAAGCSGDNFRAVANKEDMLAAAGFKFVPANTPERQQAFQRLPQHKFVREVKGDKVIYIYADPTICVCIYVGGQKAYGTYRGLALQKRIADEQVAVANDAYYMDGWDWRVWAVGYPIGWPYVDSIYNY